MIDAHRPLAFILIVCTIAASSTTAFRPSSCRTVDKLLDDSRAARASITGDVDPSSFDDDELLFVSSHETANVITSTIPRLIIRGGGKDLEEGGGEGRFNMRKADVVRYHGYLLIFLAVMSFLETVGVNTPLIGPTAILPNFNPQEDDAMKFIVRFFSAVMLCRGLYEIEFSTSPIMQRIFIRIVSMVCIITSWTMWEIGGGIQKWLYPGIAVVTVAGFLLAK